MESLVRPYFERLDKLHEEAETALADLPGAALDWSPGAEMNSLSVLAVHIAGSERFWIGDAVAEKPSGRDRESEFRSSRLSGATLSQRLRASLDYVHDVLSTLKNQDLEAERISPRDGQPVTIGWCLALVLAHTASHVGHMQITRQLWEISQRDG